MSKLIEILNPHQFAEYLKNNYKFFEVYEDNKYIGTAKYIFGYFAYVEELGEKRRITDFYSTSNCGCLLYVKS